MTLRIYNTLKGTKEKFEPIEEGKVKIYICGPTVYDSCHIGHGRAVVVFDVIVRYMEAIGYDVTYIRNFTDVDDKIINRGNETGKHFLEISEKYIKEFHEDMDALNVRRATKEPRATEHIDDIIDLVQLLIDKDKAYAVDGDVYFSVDSYKEYGKLSGRNVEDMQAGARIEIDERKKNPADFALWKSAKPEEPFWESPWGKGRPGWHIECSAMSYKLLGETFDIHGGGKDLIFPHHENEIAQSEAAFGKNFVNYWIHNGFVNIDKEKMSKSLGNFLTIKEVLKEFHPETVRMFLLSNHYRSPIDFSESSMAEANAALERIYTTLLRVEEIFGELPKIDETGELWQSFKTSMDDDFNSAQAIGTLFEVLRNTNRKLDKNRDSISDDVKKEIHKTVSDILKIGDVLGLFTTKPSEYFESRKSASSVDGAIVEALIQERKEARASKDFARADAIRDELDAMNIVIEDKADKTVWKVKS
jgi:cysteinyl-tRNA synthetase